MWPGGDRGRGQVPSRGCDLHFQASVSPHSLCSSLAAYPLRWKSQSVIFSSVFSDLLLFRKRFAAEDFEAVALLGLGAFGEAHPLFLQLEGQLLRVGLCRERLLKVGAEDHSNPSPFALVTVPVGLRDDSSCQPSLDGQVSPGS